MKIAFSNASRSVTSSRSNSGRRGGFTLLQLLVVVGLLALLSAILVGQFGQGRASVRRVECDVHLKEISLALETFRQETGADLRLDGDFPRDVFPLLESGILSESNQQPHQSCRSSRGLHG